MMRLGLPSSVSLSLHQSLSPVQTVRLTTFEYGDAKCRKSGKGFKVSVDVTNTGFREGKEIVQLYIGDHESTLERPVKELKGFKKIALAQGETKTVTFEITADMLKYYDPAQCAWVLESGKFTAYVGAASDDIRTDVEFTMQSINSVLDQTSLTTMKSSAIPDRFHRFLHSVSGIQVSWIRL